MAHRVLDHASVCIRDLERSRRFYEGILGLEPAPRPDLGVPGMWYSLGRAQLHLIQTPNAPSMPGGINPTHPHFAIEVDDLDGLRRDFKEAGVDMLDAGAQLWILDPDGNTVELRTPSGVV